MYCERLNNSVCLFLFAIIGARTFNPVLRSGTLLAYVQDGVKLGTCLRSALATCGHRSVDSNGKPEQWYDCTGIALVGLHEPIFHV